MKNTDSKRGFTLIELLVVISIIALLSSVVLASLNSARAKARDIQRKAGLVQVQNALALYYNANGAYPAGYYSTFWWATQWSTLMPSTYISVMPTDPLGWSDSGLGCSTTGVDMATRGAFYVSDGQHYFLGTSLENVSSSDPHYFYLGTTPSLVNLAGQCVSAAHWALQQ